MSLFKATITQSCLALTTAPVAVGVNSARWSRASRTVESRDCRSSAWWARCVAPEHDRAAERTRRLGIQSADRERSYRMTAAETQPANRQLIKQQLCSSLKG